MRKNLLLAIITIFITGAISAQTADEIVNHYLENIGGKEKLEKLQSMHVIASTKAQGMELPVEVYMTKDGKQLITADIQGKKIVQVAFDGETAWHTNFMNMKNEKMDKETSENMKKNAGGDFPNPFLNYKKKGYKIELVGKEEVEGTETYKIKLTQKPEMKDGKEVSKESFYYFDTENYVPVVVETVINSGPMQGAKVQQVFSDYQEVDGIYFPFSTMTKFNGQTGQEVKMNKIELNPAIDNSIFKFKETTENK